MYFMNLKVQSEALNTWQCSSIATSICVIAIYIIWQQAINYCWVRIHVSGCCIVLYIAVLRGVRAEKADHYCSSCGIGETSSFAGYTVPILMVSAPAVLGVKRELVKVESQIILLSEVTRCYKQLIFRGLISTGTWLFEKMTFPSLPHTLVTT